MPGRKHTIDPSTRGVSATQLEDDHEWWNGPDWFHLPESQWPVSRPRSESPSLDGVHEAPRSCRRSHCQTAAHRHRAMQHIRKGSPYDCLCSSLHACRRKADTSVGSRSSQANERNRKDHPFVGSQQQLNNDLLKTPRSKTNHSCGKYAPTHIVGSQSPSGASAVAPPFAARCLEHLENREKQFCQDHKSWKNRKHVYFEKTINTANVCTLTA